MEFRQLRLDFDSLSSIFFDKSITPIMTRLWLSTLLFGARLFPTSFAGCTPSSSCKIIPGDPEWPSAAKWDQLNQTVDGRLLNVSPPGAVCHPGKPTYDPEACPAVNAAWKTFDFHSANPVSSMWDLWNNETCLPDVNAPCSGAGYPVFVIDARSAANVKKGVDFGELSSSLVLHVIL
jgi:hypothetical protein